MRVQKREILCFVGPQHHMPLLKPALEVLQGHGWGVSFYTANTEAAFQVNLNEHVGVGNYHWLPDFTDKKRARTLYQQHAARLRKVMETPTVLDMMLPQVLDRIIMHSCEEWTATEALLKKLRPGRVLALHEINRWGVMLGYWCMRLEIPLYTMQEGLYYADPWIYTGHTTYGVSMVWGEGTKRQLVAAGCPEEKIRVVGHPDLGRRIAQGREEVGMIEEQRRVILLFLAHVHVGEDAVRLLADLPEGWVLVVKPHPLASLDDVQSLHRHFGGRENVRILEVETPDREKFAWIARAEVCLVAGCSSVILECLAAGKRLGIVPTEHSVRDYSQEGIAVACPGLSIWQAARKTMEEFEGQCREQAMEWVRSEACTLDAARAMADIVERGE